MIKVSTILKTILGVMLLYLLIGIITTGVCAHDPFEKERGAAIKDPADSRDLVAGEKYYNQLCASCHGVDGRATGPVGKALSVKDLTKSEMTDEGMYSFIMAGGAATGRNPAMPSFANQLGRENIENVIGHIRALQQQAKEVK